MTLTPDLDLVCPICGWEALDDGDLAIHLEDCEAEAEEALDDGDDE